MRLWVKPDRLAKLAITVPDIVSAIQAQNTVNPAGQVGSNRPRRAGIHLFRTGARPPYVPEEFGEIVVREHRTGR